MRENELCTLSFFRKFNYSLQMRGYFWSRDKYGGHTIRSTIAKNPMLHADPIALF